MPIKIRQNKNNTQVIKLQNKKNETKILIDLFCSIKEYSNVLVFLFRRLVKFYLNDNKKRSIVV